MKTPNSILREPGGSESPAIAVAGLGGGPESRFLYEPLLSDGVEWDVEPKDLYLHLYKRGLGKYSEMQKRLEEQLHDRVQRLGRPAVIIGHSAGALVTQDAIMDNPELATHFVAAAGVNKGKRFATPESIILVSALSRIPGLLEDPGILEDIKHDSGFMTKRLERIAQDWPESVGAHSVTSFFDTLLPFMHGSTIELPEGQKAEGNVIALPIPKMENILHILTSSPDIRHLRSLRPAFHLDIVRHPVLINYVRELQMGTEKTSTIPDGPDDERELPLAA